jgi:hypothetical protein
MIQRFCFVKLADGDVANRSAFADTLRAALLMGGADAIVGLPADASAARWDLSIVITAASLEAWHAISQLPAIVAVFDELATRAAVVKAWTFAA